MSAAAGQLRTDGEVVVNGLTAHYVEWGDPQAPPVVFLHGLRSYAETWEPIASAFADRYRCIALDHRGRGRSGWPADGDYSTAAYVSDVGAFVDALGLGEFLLVGHSMGGTNALVYAAANPERVRALVLEDIGPGSSTGSDGAARIKGELAATPRTFADADAARAFWRSTRPGISAEALDSRMTYTLRPTPDGDLVWRYDLEGIAAARLDPDPTRFVDLWPPLLSLTCPVLVLRGANSDFLPAPVADEMVARQPHVRLVVIPDAGHYVHDDNLAAFLPALAGYLDEVQR